MQAELLLKDLGENLGIKELSFDEDGNCSLGIDNVVLNIRWDKADNSLLIFSPIAIGLEELDPKVYEFLLSASLFGAETKSMHIGLHIPASAVVLSKTLMLDELSLQSFQDFLSFFVAEVENWKTQIENFEVPVALQEEQQIENMVRI